jgi:alkylhydroperoxidase family enzyme
MARLDYVMESPDAPADVRSIYDDIAKLRGGIVNLYRILANQPAALRAFMSMSRYVRDDSTFPPHLRELAILVTAYGLDVEYERVHHLAAARRVGVPEQKLADLPRWRERGAYTPAERAVMTYADQVAHAREVDDATVHTLLQFFTPPQVIDLAVTVAWYHFCAALIVPLGIELEREPGGGRGARKDSAGPPAGS